MTFFVQYTPPSLVDRTDLYKTEASEDAVHAFEKSRFFGGLRLCRNLASAFEEAEFCLYLRLVDLVSIADAEEYAKLMRQREDLMDIACGWVELPPLPFKLSTAVGTISINEMPRVN
jgi:hypothetical protein